jgi:hypothetical protein
VARLGRQLCASLKGYLFHCILNSALNSATLLTGSSDSQIGEALESAFKEGLVKREDLHVTSKLWNDHHGADEVPEALKKTLADLKLDYLDLYLVRGSTAAVLSRAGLFLIGCLNVVNSLFIEESLIRCLYGTVRMQRRGGAVGLEITCVG